MRLSAPLPPGWWSPRQGGPHPLQSLARLPVCRLRPSSEPIRAHHARPVTSRFCVRLLLSDRDPKGPLRTRAGCGTAPIAAETEAGPEVGTLFPKGIPGSYVAPAPPRGVGEIRTGLPKATADGFHHKISARRFLPTPTPLLMARAACAPSQKGANRDHKTKSRASLPCAEAAALNRGRPPPALQGPP